MHNIYPCNIYVYLDTALFVFGDHGMTNSGDHGGDSIPGMD